MLFSALAKRKLHCRQAVYRTLFTGQVRGSLVSRDGCAKTVSIGSFCEVSHTFPQEDVNSFSSICGDNNPLHIDPEYASKSMFKGPIVHGILVSSLFSTLFGRTIHGSIYVSQSLRFKRPVYVGAPIVARMEVLDIREHKKGRLLTCSTQCLTGKDIAIDGEAQVLLPH
jgi:acyl dehydratase